MEAAPPNYQFIQECNLGKFWIISTGLVKMRAFTELNVGDVKSANLRQQLEAQQRETYLLKQ